MPPFAVSDLLEATGRLAIAATDLSAQCAYRKGADLGALLKDLELRLGEALEACAPLSLGATFVAQAHRFKARMAAARQRELHSIEVNILVTLAFEIRHRLIEELDDNLFLAIPPHRSGLYLRPHQWFGEQTLERFPAAAADVAAACRCLAVEEWTATVFHAMRALEHGMKALARELDVTCAATLEFETWGQMLAAIEARIQQLDRAKSEEAQAKLQFFSEVATNLRYFKDAYRNPVDHARADYDEQGARYVLDHTKRFMELMARPRVGSVSA